MTGVPGPARGAPVRAALALFSLNLIVPLLDQANTPGVELATDGPTALHSVRVSPPGWPLEAWFVIWFFQAAANGPRVLAVLARRE